MTPLETEANPNIRVGPLDGAGQFNVPSFHSVVLVGCEADACRVGACPDNLLHPTRPQCPRNASIGRLPACASIPSRNSAAPGVLT